MTQMVRVLPVCAAALGAVVPMQSAVAQSFRTVSVSRLMQAERLLEVDVEFSGGVFTLVPDAGSALYRAKLVYDEDHFRVRTRYSSHSSSSHHLALGVIAEDLQGKFKWDEGAQQYMDVALSPLVPTKLDVELGAARANLELGGLSLVDVSIHTGASETYIAFSAPNRGICEEFDLTAGATELRVEGLGNARCQRIEIGGGVGEITVDFSGEWGGASVTDAEVKMGLGALTLRLPRHLGVEITMSRLLVSFDHSGFTKQGSRYVSSNYDSAATKLHLDIEAAFGDVKVVWIN